MSNEIRLSGFPIRGDCYESAGNIAVDFLQRHGKNLILVHAEVQGQGALSGTTLGHAWIEDQDRGLVLDYANGRGIELPVEVYRSIGKVDSIGNEFRYTQEEARRKILDHEHWGPWDLETSSGL